MGFSVEICEICGRIAALEFFNNLLDALSPRLRRERPGDHGRLDIDRGGERQQLRMKFLKRRLTRTSPFSACGRASLVHDTQLPAGSILRVRSIGQLDIALLKEV